MDIKYVGAPPLYGDDDDDDDNDDETFNSLLKFIKKQTKKAF